MSGNLEKAGRDPAPRRGGEQLKGMREIPKGKWDVAPRRRKVNLGFGLGQSSGGSELPGCSKHDRVCHLEGPNLPSTHGLRPQL